MIGRPHPDVESRNASWRTDTESEALVDKKQKARLTRGGRVGAVVRRVFQGWESSTSKGSEVRASMVGMGP